MKVGYVLMKKRQQQSRESILKKEIETATKDIHLHITDKDWMEQLNKKQEELEELKEQKLKDALIRARWQQLSEGE